MEQAAALRARAIAKINLVIFHLVVHVVNANAFLEFRNDNWVVQSIHKPIS
jgi:hypothetical protein